MGAFDEGTGDETAGHGGTHDEGSEDGVEFDVVGPPRAETHEGEEEGVFAVGDGAAGFDAGGPFSEDGADDEEGEGDIGGGTADIDEGVGGVAFEACEDDGEEHPCHGVVDGACADGDGAHDGTGEPLEVNDAGEHGEGGDAHGRAHEDGGDGEGGGCGEEAGVGFEVPAEERAEDEGGGHASEGDGDRGAEAFTDDVHAEFEADDEHVEGEAELGGREEDLHGVLGEEGGGPFGRDGPEEGGTEEDPGDHFGDDLGLAEFCGDEADDPAEHEDDGDLEEELDGELEIGHGGAAESGREVKQQGRSKRK